MTAAAAIGPLNFSPGRIDRTLFDWYYDATDVTLSGSNVLTMPNQGVGVFAAAQTPGTTPRALWRNGKYAVTPTGVADAMRLVGQSSGLPNVGTFLFVAQLPSAPQMSANFRVMVGGNGAELYYPFYTGTAAGQWETNMGTARAWGATRPAGGTPFAAVIRINGASTRLDLKPLGGTALSATVAGSPGANPWPAATLLIGVARDGQFPWSAPVAVLARAPGTTIFSDAAVAAVLAQAAQEYAL